MWWIMLERESCPRAAERVKRNGAAGMRFMRWYGAQRNVQDMHDWCDINSYYLNG